MGNGKNYKGVTMIEVLTKLPKYWLSRKTGNVPLPLNYTIGLTYRCNARCKTCNVWDRANKEEELTPEEWEWTFSSLGNSPYWVTLTGGEPFLYKDIEEVFYNLCTICKPTIVNIPTNGQLTKVIYDTVWDMVKMFPKIKVVVNVSLDHYLPFKNDEIRGTTAYYKNAIETIKALQTIHSHNLTVGIHTVISKYNIGELPEISCNLKKLLTNKHNHLAEIAEHRVELKTIGLDITPNASEFSNAIECFYNNAELNGSRGLPRIRQAFRQQYYQAVNRWLSTGKTGIPCWAGYLSCQITPDGEIWFCCIKAKSIGNLKDYLYRFDKLWNNNLAKSYRKLVKDCYCPMANVNYTNMLLDTRSMYRVVRSIL